MPQLFADASGLSFTDVALRLAASHRAHDTARDLFDQVLPAVLNWTGSTLAFAATVSSHDHGQPVLLGGAGHDVLREQHSLWDAVLHDRQPVVKSYAATADVQSVLGWPLIHGGQVVGVIGLANRPQGYDHTLVQALQAGLTIVAGLLATSLLAQRSQRALATLASTEDTLRVNEQQYRQIFEAAGVGLVRISPDGRFLEVNQRFADIAGRARESLLGLHTQEVAHPLDAATESAMLESCLHGERERYHLEKRYQQPNGDVVWVSVTAVLVRDGQNRPLHFVSVVEDISERRHYHEALTSAKAAERASKAKTEFLSRMSHELRTPLNAMLGFAQLLRLDHRHPLQDAQAKKLDHIEQAGAHLLAMLTDVLDLSRIEAGSLPLSLETVGVGIVLDEAVNMVAHQVASANLNMQLTLPDEPLFVRADQVRLRQTLVNLLSNAIKYNRPQGRIMLEAMALPPHVVITVSDTGIGISHDQQKHLFEPFNRLGAERTAIEGSGIGLVIVKRLVDLMQGRLEVSSTVDCGSSFRVWLPQAKTPVPSDALDLPAWALPATARGAHAPSHLPKAMAAGSRTVLYAEDNPINVELVQQVLRLRPQWHLEVANCGSQAIDMAKANPPDLLLLDMHLGDMNGTDVSDALMYFPHTAHIPRVALTADVMPDQVREVRERGFLDFISKPLDVSRLLALLDRLAQSPDAAQLTPTDS